MNSTKQIRIETLQTVFYTTYIDDKLIRKEFRRICQEIQTKDFIEIINEDRELTMIRTSLIQNVRIYD